MKTDNDIYKMYCIDNLGYIPLEIEKKYILNSYGFMMYRLNIRFKDFIESIVKTLKLDKILKLFKDK